MMTVPPRSVFLMKTTSSSSTHLMAGFPFPAVSEIISSSSISQYSSSLRLSPSQKWLAISFCYMLGSNFIYLARRANLRRMSKLRILRIRTEREPGVSWPLYFAFLLAWQWYVKHTSSVRVIRCSKSRVSLAHNLNLSIFCL